MLLEFCTFYLITLLVANSSRDTQTLVRYGEDTTIEQYPHSVILRMSCGTKVDNRKSGKRQGGQCGASVLNQYVLLTAAHCLNPCIIINGTNTAAGWIEVGVGYTFSNFTAAPKRYVARFIKHPMYKKHAGYDIALLGLKQKLKFGPKVQRVVILPKRPNNVTIGTIAGWGLTQEDKLSNVLKMAPQHILSDEVCRNITLSRFNGTFCANATREYTFGHTGRGDSGSALVVNQYIQIGLVSYKIFRSIDQFDISNTTTVYTDVSYYYNWIQAAAKKLACWQT